MKASLAFSILITFAILALTLAHKSTRYGYRKVPAKHEKMEPKYSRVWDSARYHVEVDFQWKEDCPLPNGVQEHFSPVVGCSHAKPDPFLKVGDLASKAVESLAETGNPKKLAGVIEDLVDCGLCHKQIGPYDAVNSPGELEFEVTVNRENPHVSFISMIAPSPDWFTGILNIDLRQDDYDWKDKAVYMLGKYDAGTEEGYEFATDNYATCPPQPIGPIVDRDIGVIGKVVLTRLDRYY